MIDVSREEIDQFAPRPPKAGARQQAWEAYARAIESDAAHRLFAEFEITTNRRWQHFAAMVATETGGFTVLWESGAYSAAGILRVFGAGKHSARVSAAEAERLAGNGPALFERVYGLGNPKKAKELGNTEPGDGWRFRGLGPAQITGRWAHERYAGKIGCTLEELCDPLNALHAALLEWRDKGCNAWADRDDVVSIRKLINGGSLKVSVAKLNGLEDAKSYARRAKRIWRDDEPPAEPPASTYTPPASVAESSEANTGAAISAGGGLNTSLEISAAMAKVAASGKGFTLAEFLLQLATSPTFWGGAFFMVGGAYIWLRRRTAILKG